MTIRLRKDKVFMVFRSFGLKVFEIQDFNPKLAFIGQSGCWWLDYVQQLGYNAGSIILLLT